MQISDRYPIGTYQPQPYSTELRDEWIRDIQNLPQLLENAVSNLDEAQLETPYREGGWTVKQLVHHVADSHMNAYIRFKLGLTEDNPVIKPYQEEKWAELEDTRNLPVNVSLTLLHALHFRWYHVLKSIQNGQWERTVVHPQQGRQMTLWYLLGSYVWHGKHHTEHVIALKKRLGWR